MPSIHGSKFTVLLCYVPANQLYMTLCRSTCKFTVFPEVIKILRGYGAKDSNHQKQSQVWVKDKCS